MSFAINNELDIYKFALSLHDQLIQSGNSELAASLADITDDCFSSPEKALDAHKDAFIRIKEKAVNLPDEYLTALDSGISLLEK